ncbi:hypothetical protein ACFLT9_11345, partial [Acidobacteriota bacterium]
MKKFKIRPKRIDLDRKKSFHWTSFPVLKAVLGMGLGIILTANGFTQDQGKFPDQSFNGMQITYSISGATVTETKDKSGFTTARTLNGELGAGALVVSGSAVIASGYGATVTVRVWVGAKKQEFTKELKRTSSDGSPSTPFNLSVPIQPGSEGGFTIQMDGHYSMGGGHRGLVVSGAFQSRAVQKPTPKPPSKKPLRTETFRVFGNVKDANGHLLPHLRVLVKLGDKEKVVKVGLDGAFEHKADLPVPLSKQHMKARIRVVFNCVWDGKTWFQLAIFPPPAKLPGKIMVVHKFALDESNNEIQKDINFGSPEWSNQALTNIDTPSKLKKISVIYRNTFDAWKFAREKLKVD